ncbi:MAG: barstar family protein [Jatrophihabitantaceae bacterium]
MTGEPGWTHLAASLPWLRGQGVHLAGQSSRALVAGQLTAAAFTLATATATGAGAGSRYRPVSEALRLPASAADNLDALADSLRDLPDRWPGTHRLALLVPEAQHLIEADLLGWTDQAMLLRQASSALWAEHRFVFGTVFLVPDGSYGADRPS